MPEYQEHYLAEVRLCLLRVLAVSPAQRTNSSVLQTALEAWGFSVTRAVVHAELGELAQLGAVAVETPAGAVEPMIAALTSRGLDHVERRVVLPGVKRPTPR